MRKLFYLLCIVSFSALTITSCTEDEVKPSQDLNGGANGTGDVLK